MAGVKNKFKMHPFLGGDYKDAQIFPALNACTKICPFVNIKKGRRH